MKPTIKLVLILILCSIILAVYALLPEKPLIYGDWGFRQLPLQRALAENAEAADSLYEDTTATEEVDTAKQRILFFGDSMVGAMCYRIAKYAAQNGHTLECVTEPSTTTYKWGEGDKLRLLLDDYHPTYVFICLGSNELYSKDMEAMERNVRKINSIIGNDIPVVWIGPPNWCEDGGINKAIENVVGKKSFFLSKNLDLERRPDGRHPNNEGAAKWADTFAKWMQDRKCAHPILFKTPSAGVKGKMILLYHAPEHGIKNTNVPTEEETIPEEEEQNTEPQVETPVQQESKPKSETPATTPTTTE